MTRAILGSHVPGEGVVGNEPHPGLLRRDNQNLTDEGSAGMSVDSGAEAINGRSISPWSQASCSHSVPKAR